MCNSINVRMREEINVRPILGPFDGMPLAFLGLGEEVRTRADYRWDETMRQSPGFLLLQITLDGMGVFGRTTATEREVPPGTAFLVWIPSRHCYRFDPARARHWHFVWAMLGGSALHDYWKHFGARDFTFIKIPPRHKIVRSLQRWRSETDRGGPIDWQLANSASWLIHQLLMLHAGAPSATRAKVPRMPEGLRTRIGKDGWASHHGVSRFQLYRQIKKESGFSPRDYLARQRIELACSLLAGSDEAIRNVALRCGFDDPNYFARFFRRQTGHSPGIWRERFGRASKDSIGSDQPS